MQETQRTHLDELENQSIFIFREAYHAFKNIAMPWSMGKDSNVLVWLARKAFFGRVPFPSAGRIQMGRADYWNSAR